MASIFLGSGSTYLSRTYEPTDDRFDYDESDDDYDFEDELRSSCDSLSGTSIRTLDEVGFSYTPYGGIILHSKKEKVEAVFKKTKVPFGTKLAKLGPNECGICLNDIATDALVRTSCDHQYCRECLAYYLHLQSGDLKNIQHTMSHLETNENGHFLRIQRTCGVICPHPTCNKIIEGEEFRSFVSEETWDRFNNLALLLLLRAMEKTGEVAACPEHCGGFVQNCMCTTFECRQRALMLAERERLILFRQWKKAERDGMMLLRKWAMGTARQCPKCGFLIEKNGGCDHMACTACKTQYNWSASGVNF